MPTGDTRAADPLTLLHAEKRTQSSPLGDYYSAARGTSSFLGPKGGRQRNETMNHSWSQIRSIGTAVLSPSKLASSIPLASSESATMIASLGNLRRAPFGGKKRAQRLRSARFPIGTMAGLRGDLSLRLELSMGQLPGRL